MREHGRLHAACCGVSQCVVPNRICFIVMPRPVNVAPITLTPVGNTNVCLATWIDLQSPKRTLPPSGIAGPEGKA